MPVGRTARRTAGALAGALVAGMAVSAAAQDVGAPDIAAGFDFSTISRFVEGRKATVAPTPALTPEQAARRTTLHAIAQRFRSVAVADPALLMPAFALRDPRVLAGLLSSPAALHTPAIWRYFFYGSLVHLGRIAAPVSRVGFYNPHADGWVLTDWRWTGGYPDLVAVSVTTGEALREARVDALLPVAWSRSGRPPAAIRDAVGLGAVAFAKAHPMLSTEAVRDAATPAARRSRQAGVELRLLARLRALADHDRSPAYAAATRDLLAAVRAADVAALKRLTADVPHQTLHRVAGLPRFMRRRIELGAMYATQSGALVVFGVPLMPRWIVMAEYRRNPKDGSVVVAGLAVVDVASPPRRRSDRP